MHDQMRLTEDIYLVGSAEFGLSNAYDCHVYLLDGGEEATLIDCGVGYDTGQIIRNIEKYIDIEKVKKVYLSHDSVHKTPSHYTNGTHHPELPLNVPV